MSQLRAYRICRSEYAETAFTGDGAIVISGRWHSKGTPVVYCSASLSGAQLELLVNLRGRVRPLDFVYFEIHFSETLVGMRFGTADLEQLFVDWRSPRAPAVLRDIGDEWAKSAVERAEGCCCREGR